MKTHKLVTVRNYAKGKGYTTQYVYQLIRNNKLPSIEIDGVKFIQIK